ncbi:MAG: alpha/beta hydrolase [Lachnospiraceae bacterium]|nr:alpha/beta hydrolase [Lachnospiraceae bacterium]
MVTREEFYMESVDEVHMIHGYRWYDPQRETKGVLQLVHGMLEYIGRYDRFASHMAEAGYFVVGHDHLGHGDSVNSPEERGCVGEDGASLWLRDIDQVRRMTAASMPDVPYIMLGHSMGSFLVRRYLIYRGKKVDGAIIMGTGQQPAFLCGLGRLVVSVSMLGSGRDGRSRLLDQMTCSGYAKRFPDNARTGSWLSRDPQVMLDMLPDTKMAFRFSLGAYEALFQTFQEVVTPRAAARMPKDLPLLILSGDEDPVGENGKGTRRFEEMLRKIGMEDVRCMIYPHGRHELLNELNKEEVMNDIELWCADICARSAGEE